MVLKQRLDQRQVQKLILAPALQQAIKLLPLTHLELIEIIDSEMSQNPMLEEVISVGKAKKEGEEASDEGRGEREAPEGQAEIRPEENAELLWGREGLDFETSFQQYFDDGFRTSFSEKKEMPSLENTLSKSPSLWDHLNWQANLTFFDKEEREIAQLIIGNINEDGYLTASVEELVGMGGNSPEKMNGIRTQIMSFDPVGCGSVNLREVLLAQMDSHQIQDEITRAIVGQHLGLLEKSDFTSLAKVLRISLQDVKTHIEVIRSLDPTPGLKYSQEKTFYVVPDIFVDKEGDELKINLNDEGLPRLKINSYYRKLLAKAAKDNPDAHAFLKDKLKKALWFLRSLDQRDRTVYKVAKYIVEKQQDFFEKGIEYIKPLTLMEIAQEIGVHESTVGRVVANKHMITPRGVFSLKYFFHKSLVGDYGEEISSLRIKERIKKLVENEERDSPMSDIEIGEILAKENLKIARRTVAKYRKQLKIPPSHIRKRKSLLEGNS